MIEELKLQIEHSIEMSAETQKNIQKHKRNPDSIYKGAEQPKRIWKIMANGLYDMKETLEI